MITESDFVEAIQKEPNNSKLRLVFADWLEDRGDQRGEFIRCWHVWRDEYLCNPDLNYSEILPRICELVGRPVSTNYEIPHLLGVYD